MQNFQNIFKDSGFKKLLEKDDIESIINHFLIKILEYKQIDQTTLDLLYK